MAYTFTTIDEPNETFTQVLGINDKPQMVGFHNATTPQGFQFTLPNSFTPENVPLPGGAAAPTTVVGIDNTGISDGFYLDAGGTTHGFTDSNGQFTTEDEPNTAFNQLLSINDLGQQAGYSSLDKAGQTLQLAYVRQADGTYTLLDNAAHTLKLPANVNSQATGINATGDVVGFYMPSATTSNGFEIDSSGRFTSLQVPGSTFTQALGINAQGQIVGFSNDAAGNAHGFVFEGGTYTTVDVPGASSTTINTINDFGQVVGFDVNATTKNTDGFAGTDTANFSTADATLNRSWTNPGVAYTGPVAGLKEEYVNITKDNLNVAASTPNTFIHTGAGEDAIDVSSVGGTNVLDGGTGSNFLVGGKLGAGSDTFFIDARAAGLTWSTVENFHAGDSVTAWGISPSFTLTKADNMGAIGHTGLTLDATSPNAPEARVTLPGYSMADLSNGRLSLTFGTDPASGNNYMFLHAN